MCDLLWSDPADRQVFLKIYFYFILFYFILFIFKIIYFILIILFISSLLFPFLSSLSLAIGMGDFSSWSWLHFW